MDEDTPDWLRLIDDLGLTVPVGQVVPTDDGEAELVKTYADCAITAVFFRQPAGSHRYPSVLDPIAISGGSGGSVGGLHVMRHGPVDSWRKRIVVSFDRSAPWDRDAGVAIPVDRGRTARFDRYLAGDPPREEQDGVRAAVVAVRAGLMRAEVDLFLQAQDPSILALELGRFGFHRHIPRGPGASELWKEWRPPPSSSQRTERREKDGRMTISVSSGFSVAARRLSPAEMKALPPLREPPEPWTATSLPDGEPLGKQGSSESGGAPRDKVERTPTLYLDAPGEDAESIRLSVDELWAFRADHARAITPLPRPDEPVDLGGIELKGEMCRVQLLRWDPSDQGFTLHAKVDPPAMWPDIRVLADGSSVSMSTQPPDEGDLRAMLPLSYSAIFSGSTIEIAIRMAARTVEPMVFVLPLTPADRRTAG